jgi:hypothetical protein
MSCGSTATPTGAGRGSIRRGASWCSRAEDAAVEVSQYSVISVSIRSSLICERGSVHCTKRSTIQTSWPTGESVSA